MSELTFAEVGQILRLLQAIEGSEVDLEWGDLRLRVRRGEPSSIDRDPVAPAPAARTEQADPEPDASVAPDPEARPEARAEGGENAVPDHWVAIGAPMVGTFYRSPKPGEPAYVEVGDVVSVGDTVALVEVMKLFTELKAESAGKVARIDAEDAALVEFGQPLLWIEPA